MQNLYEVIVLGLGAMGSAAAYHLAAGGNRVLGLERFTPAHSLGSSHGQSRIIRQAYHEDVRYVPLARRAYELWERLERDSGIGVLHRTGGLMIGRPGSSVMEGALSSARQHDLPVKIFTAKKLRQRFPAFNPRPDDIAIYEEGAGFLRPEAAIQAHLRLAAQAGADLRFGEPALSWTAREPGKVVVHSSAGTYQAARLVLTPGAWAPQLLTDLQIPFDVRRQVMCWFQPVSGLDNFQSDVFPIYIWDVDGAHCFYGFPTVDNAGVKAARHGGGECSTADTLERRVLDADVTQVRSYLRDFIPSLNGAFLRGSPCMYTMTPDSHFILGLHPRHSQVCVAAGFSGHGFKFASVVGDILTDLAIHGRTNYPIQFLSPNRFGG